MDAKQILLLVGIGIAILIVVNMSGEQVNEGINGYEEITNREQVNEGINGYEEITNQKIVRDIENNKVTYKLNQEMGGKYFIAIEDTAIGDCSFKNGKTYKSVIMYPSKETSTTMTINGDCTLQGKYGFTVGEGVKIGQLKTEIIR